MFSNDEYRLIDFGDGRRLERFGALVLDRPCPSAVGVRRAAPSLWSGADARFVEQNAQNTQNKTNNRRGVAAKNNAALGFRGVWRASTELGRQYFNVESDVDAAQGQVAEKLSSRPWTISFDDKFLLELKGSPFGHLGVFPEQAENWTRIFDLCREGSAAVGRPLRVLNLFGYTGGSALAAAAAGAETTHLDAARNIVAQARRNAALSFPDAAVSPTSAATPENPENSQEKTPQESKNSANSKDLTSRPNAPKSGPIRWIVDDAVKFVKREQKRGAFYDGVILDPPTYGHGARGEVWRVSRDLTPLLERLAALLPETFSFILLTCHTPGFEAPTLDRILRTIFAERFGSDAFVKRTSKPLAIRSEKNGALPAGDLALAVRRPPR